MVSNNPGIKIYEPSEKGVTAMRKASFRNIGLNRYVRLSDYETLQAECERLVEALEDIGASWHGVNTELERYMRNVARLALAAHRKGGES